MSDLPPGFSVNLQTFVHGGTPDDSAFYRALQSEDDLGAVVRAHLHIESRLDALLMKRLEPSAADTILSDEHRTIHTWKIRVDWAYALGLMSEPMYRMILEIGRLRDRFAHNLYKEIEQRDLDKLLARLTPFCRDTLNIVLQNPAPFWEAPSKPPPRIQVRIILVLVRGELGLITQGGPYATNAPKPHPQGESEHYSEGDSPELILWGLARLDDPAALTWGPLALARIFRSSCSVV